MSYSNKKKRKTKPHRKRSEVVGPTEAEDLIYRKAAKLKFRSRLGYHDVEVDRKMLV